MVVVDVDARAGADWRGFQGNVDAEQDLVDGDGAVIVAIAATNGALNSLR
jgi:hypothetical protein